MARWGFIIGLLVIIGALSLVSVNLIFLPGDPHYIIGKAGFISGIVHGLLAPITLILALFIKVNMYELNNVGWWYNLGFLLGLLSVWAGGQKTRSVTKNYYYGDSKQTKGISKSDWKDVEKIIEKKVEERVKNKKQKNSKNDWKFWNWDR